MAIPVEQLRRRPAHRFGATAGDICRPDVTPLAITDRSASFTMPGSTLTICDVPDDPATLRALMQVAHAAGMAMATDEPEETMNQELEDEGLALIRHLQGDEAAESEAERKAQRIAIRVVVAIAAALILWAAWGWAT